MPMYLGGSSGTTPGSPDGEYTGEAGSSKLSGDMWKMLYTVTAGGDVTTIITVTCSEKWLFTPPVLYSEEYGYVDMEFYEGSIIDVPTTPQALINMNRSVGDAEPHTFVAQVNPTITEGLRLLRGRLSMDGVTNNDGLEEVVCKEGEVYSVKLTQASSFDMDIDFKLSTFANPDAVG